MDERASTAMTEFATRLIHTGGEPDPETGAVMPPIYMTSTYAQESPGHTKGYDYTRAGNPNFTRLEEVLASLENAKHATVFSSGLGSLTAMVHTLSPGDHVLGLNGLYGGTYRLFKRIFEKWGLKFTCVSANEVEASLAKLKPQWLFFETPTNPLMELYDIAHLAALGKKSGARIIVDNTFATPYFQNPLDLGADIVWHSTTKYIGGHSDVIGGAVMTSDAEFKKQLDFHRMAIGLNPSPFDTWLIMRGVKTLAVRMDRHQENAFKIAQTLEKHPKIKRVYYPGLTSHAQHELAKKQMKGYSGMVSAEFDLPVEIIKERIANMHCFTLAESLGGVESLVCHPASMTHASIPPEERKRIGLSDGLIRFSVGLEDVRDLLKDIDLIKT